MPSASACLSSRRMRSGTACRQQDAPVCLSAQIIVPYKLWQVRTVQTCQSADVSYTRVWRCMRSLNLAWTRDKSSRLRYEQMLYSDQLTEKSNEVHQQISALLKRLQTVGPSATSPPANINSTLVAFSCWNIVRYFNKFREAIVYRISSSEATSRDG